MQDDSSSLISGFGAASTATSPTQSVLSAMTYDSTDPAAAILVRFVFVIDRPRAAVCVTVYAVNSP